MTKDNQWWLQGPIIAYASSHEGCANQVISKAQFDSALPKNREKFDVPLMRFAPATEQAKPDPEYMAFNPHAQCSPTLTQCPRCNNPHNACDQLFGTEQARNGAGS